MKGSVTALPVPGLEAIISGALEILKIAQVSSTLYPASARFTLIPVPQVASNNKKDLPALVTQIETLSKTVALAASQEGAGDLRTRLAGLYAYVC